MVHIAAALRAAEKRAKQQQDGEAGVEEEDEEELQGRRRRRQRRGRRTDFVTITRIGLAWASIWEHQAKVKAVYLGIRVQIFVACLIGGNFLVNIIEKQLDPKGDQGMEHIWNPFELFFNIAFTVELFVNMYANWCCDFWRSGWNIFDLLVVTIGILTTVWTNLPGPLKLLRIIRAFRVFRLFKRVTSLNKILKSLAKAVPGVANAFLILVLVMSIYAILAVDLFREHGKGGHFFNEANEQIEYMTPRGQEYGFEYFGNFGKAWYTMFQVMAAESWSEAVARPMVHQRDVIAGVGTAIFFSSFSVVVAVVLVNVMVAVLLEKMVDDEPQTADVARMKTTSTRRSEHHGGCVACLNHWSHKLGFKMKRSTSTTSSVGGWSRGSFLDNSPRASTAGSEADSERGRASPANRQRSSLEGFVDKADSDRGRASPAHKQRSTLESFADKAESTSRSFLSPDMAIMQSQQTNPLDASLSIMDVPGDSCGKKAPLSVQVINLKAEIDGLRTQLDAILSAFQRLTPSGVMAPVVNPPRIHVFRDIAPSTDGMRRLPSSPHEPAPVLPGQNFDEFEVLQAFEDSACVSAQQIDSSEEVEQHNFKGPGGLKPRARPSWIETSATREREANLTVPAKTNLSDVLSFERSGDVGDSQSQRDSDMSACSPKTETEASPMTSAVPEEQSTW